jgi:hypothetical protein
MLQLAYTPTAASHCSNKDWAVPVLVSGEHHADGDAFAGGRLDQLLRLCATQTSLSVSLALQASQGFGLRRACLRGRRRRWRWWRRR